MFLPIGDDNIKGGHFPLFSYSLIALNVLIFIYQASLAPEALERFIFEFGAVPAEIERGQNLYTLFTSMFLHGGIMHLVGNMLFLWIFADNIEATIGNFRFLFFYIVGGLAAHAAHLFFNPGSEIPTVGASGAISAVMGAYLVMFPRSQIRVLFLFFFIRLSAFVFLGLWIVQQLMAGTAELSVETAQTSGVAYWAHIGGFFYGVAMGFYYRNRYRRPQVLDPRDFV